MSASYMIKAAARCLVAMPSDEQAHSGSFLTATCMSRGANEIRMLRFYEEEDDVECAGVYDHPQEVSCLSCHAVDPTLVATAYRTLSADGAQRVGASIWRLPLARDGRAGPDDVDSVTKQPLQHVADIPAPTQSCRVMHVQWFPPSDASDTPGSSSTNQLLCVNDTVIRVWALLSDGSLSLMREITTSDVEHVGGAAWDPHHAHEVAVAADASITVWDVRSGDSVRTIANAVPPGSCVRALSYNPNKPWHLASAGDDYRVKVWDLRKLGAPVKILDGHTHWVTSVAFNPFHDQLMISGGTDARVNLWRVSSISSAPLLELGDDDEEESGQAGGRKETKMAPDAALKSHEDHDDSVYALCWSSKTPWVYASLSYTGKVVICTVPSTEKYKILL